MNGRKFNQGYKKPYQIVYNDRDPVGISDSPAGPVARMQSREGVMWINSKTEKYWIRKDPRINEWKGPFSMGNGIVGAGQVANTGLYDFLGQSADREQFIYATGSATYGVLPYPGDYAEGDFFGIKAFSDIIVNSYYTVAGGILPASPAGTLTTHNAVDLSTGSSAVWVNSGTEWILYATYYDNTPYSIYTTATLPTPPVAGSPVTLPRETEKYTINTTHPVNSNIILPSIISASGVPDYPFRIVNRDLQIFNNTTNTYIINATRTDMLHPMNILPGQTLFFQSNKNSIAINWSLVSETNPLKLATAVANSTVALVDVTGLGVALIANRSYRFKFFIAYTSGAVPTGSVWTLNGPAGTVHYTSERSNTSTQDANVSGQPYNSIVGLSNSSATTTSNVCIIEGVITPTANGTLIPRFASEVVGSPIVALANFSYLDIKRL